ncbi:hypothetical protein [Planctobacterium marinum]|uniref:Uncharacterized protein n=1 Tax=Planctobacterium marinum TaxID=1631968 RepID=A0AA48HJD6_9ALTE|nr:hypothetical protein MACH26_01930 [Planctobacterium marinum]
MDTRLNKNRNTLLALIAFLFAVAIFGDVSSFVEGFVNGFNDAIG